MRDFFMFDGVNSKDMGIALQSPVTFSAPVPKVNVVTVPGKNGDLHFFENAYENISAEASCFVLNRDVAHSVSEINRWLLNPGYKRLCTSDDETIYYQARAVSGADLAVRMRVLAPFDIKFDCKPQKFLVSGDSPIVLTAPMAINNPGVGGLPLLKIYGVGTGTVFVNGYRIEIKNLKDYIIIDSETQNAYKGDGLNKNSDILCDDFPALSHGANAVSWTGDIQRIELTPRWFCL